MTRRTRHIPADPSTRSGAVDADRRSADAVLRDAALYGLLAYALGALIVVLLVPRVHAGRGGMAVAVVAVPALVAVAAVFTRATRGQWATPLSRPLLMTSRACWERLMRLSVLQAITAAVSLALALGMLFRS